MTPDRAQLDELVEAQPRLVVVGDDHDLGPDELDEAAQRPRHLGAGVEDALGGRVAAVEPLAGDPVVLGSVPGDQGLPDVVVGEVPVLVVGRVEVREVHLVEQLDELAGVAAHRRPAPEEQLGCPELEGL